jgi:hypothetical protein
MMKALKWEPLDATNTPGAALMASMTWYRARLPHGWLVQSVQPRKGYVGGREVTVEGSIGDGSTSAFVPLGPAPWN